MPGASGGAVIAAVCRDGGGRRIVKKKASVAARAPSLTSVLGPLRPGRQDGRWGHPAKEGAAALSFRAGQDALPAGPFREPAADSSNDRGRAATGLQRYTAADSSRQAPPVPGRRERLVAELAQGVVGGSQQLAGDLHRGPVSSEPARLRSVADARPGGRRLVPRPHEVG